MGPSTKGPLINLVDHRLKPSIAQLRPKGQFALKVWKNCKKLQNAMVGFEPALIRLTGSALDHSATSFI